MATLPTRDSSTDLREVTVRPTWGSSEHRRWDRLVAEHHYLPFHGVIGKGLRHVAVNGETWLALIGWQPGAFKLAARDGWIGWSAEQQFRRLHLIANNVRFVILTPDRVPNLASRVLGLSLRRLSGDMQVEHGYPVLLAETFVDPARFPGTCYRASNWRSLGLTRGFAREPGGPARWRHHGQPKEIFVFELTAGAAEALSRNEMPAQWSVEPHSKPMAAPRLRRDPGRARTLRWPRPGGAHRHHRCDAHPARAERSATRRRTAQGASVPDETENRVPPVRHDPIRTP